MLRCGEDLTRFPMRLLLDALYLLASPCVLTFLLFRSRFFTRKRYRAGLKEKLGWVEPRGGHGPCLWVHAVSVGEVRTSLPLLKALATEFPDWDFVLSTSTDTGHETARKGLLKEGLSVRVLYFPVDLSRAVLKSLRAIRPAGIVLIELELWPNFLLAARSLGIPVLVANGRLTERSARRYRAAGPLGRFLFSLPAGFAVQNEDYATRFASVGVPQDRVAILGNLKYDVPPGAAPPLEETLVPLGWSAPREEDHPLVMGGCTHPGEEKVLLELVSVLRARFPGIRLILAPRHIERAREVLDAARTSSIGSAVLWSDVSARGASSNQDLRVVVVDVIGELDRFYRLADLVFVGGTLIPHGGQNLLEPARLGKPVVFGPSIHNFEDVARRLLEGEAAVQVGDPEDLGRQVEHLLGNREARNRLGQRACQVSTELGGALGRHLEWLKSRLQPVVSALSPERKAAP